MSLRSWFAYAFGIEPPGEAVPTPEQAALVERFAGWVSQRGVETPVLLSLEMCKPLGYVSSQMLHVLSPSVSVLFNRIELDTLAAFLERRGSIDYIIRTIEEAASARAPEARTDPESVTESDPDSGTDN